MYIRSIHLKDFCNVQNQSLTNLPDAVALFGYNGQGKTTVLYALQLLLFGHCDRTDKRGAGADAMIRDGAKQADIAAEIAVGDDTIKVFMTIKRKGANDWGCCFWPTGECIDGVEDRKTLWKHLGINPDYARVAAFASQMLHSKELSDPLADFLSSELDIDKLIALCAGHYPWFLKFAEGRTMSPVHDGLTNPNTKARLEAKHFEELGAAAYERRTAGKKERATAHDAAEAAGFIAPPKDGAGKEITADRIPALTDQLKRMRAASDALHVALGVAQTAHTAEQVADMRAAADAALTAAQHDEVTTRATADQFRAEHDQRRADVSSAEQALSQAKLAHVRQEEDLKRVERELAEIGDACPTCGAALKAAVKKEMIEPRKKRIEELKQAVATTGDECVAALQRLTDAREVESTIRKKKEAAESAHGNARSALAKAQAAADAVPTPYDGKSAVDIEAEIEDLRAKIDRCDNAIATLKKIEAQAHDRKVVENLDVEIAELDWCVKAFHYGEILKQLLGSPVTLFTDRCNKELTPLGYELSVATSDKQFQPMLRCPGDAAPRPVAQCSAGQQTLAAVAIASAFADTGAPMLVDDLNDLDPKNRGAVLLRMRQKAEGSVICAATWQQRPEDTATVAGKLAPVAAYWVEGGGYSLLGETASGAVAQKEAA